MKDLVFHDGTSYIALLNGIDAKPVTCLEASRGLPKGRFFCVRHDLDNELENVMELAKIETVMGIRASYFFLHIMKYFGTQEMHDLCRNLCALEHEVGLHVDFVGAHCWGRTDMEQTLYKALKVLRRYGGEVRGVASHGRTECYDTVLNYEFWQEFDPNRWEGVGKRKIHPVSLKDFGLEYEAYFLPYDVYFDDSAGVWSGLMTEGLRPIPFERHMRGGEHDIGKEAIERFNRMESGLLQLLVHPVWWKVV